MLEVRERSPDQRLCPLCHDTLEQERQACVACETEYHAACLAELGGCSTLGCRLRGKLPDALPNWFCRDCHQPIESDLTRRNCRCGAYLHDGCVEAHAKNCAHAAELRQITSHPDTRARRAAISRTWPLATWVAAVLLLLLYAGWVGLSALDAETRPAQASVPGADMRTWPIEVLLPRLFSEGDQEGPAHRELRRRGVHARYDLLRALGIYDYRTGRAQRVLEEALGKPARQVVLEACRDPDPRIRKVAVETLADLRPGPEEIAALKTALRDMDPGVRQTAEQTLAICHALGLVPRDPGPATPSPHPAEPEPRTP